MGSAAREAEISAAAEAATATAPTNRDSIVSEHWTVVNELKQFGKNKKYEIYITEWNKNLLFFPFSLRFPKLSPTLKISSSELFTFTSQMKRCPIITVREKNPVYLA